MTDQTHFIIIRETIMESVITDGFTFLTIFALMIVAKYFDSFIFEVITGTMMVIFIFGLAKGSPSKMSIDEARAKLDKIEQGLGQ